MVEVVGTSSRDLLRQAVGSVGSLLVIAAREANAAPHQPWGAGGEQGGEQASKTQCRTA